MSKEEACSTALRSLRVRCTSIDITPRKPVILAGCDYRDRERTHEAIHDPLTAQIFLLEGNETSSIIVTLDLLYAGEKINQACHEAARISFPAASVMVFASHTHAACATDSSKPKLGRVCDEVVSRICEELSMAITNLEEMVPRECLLEFRSTTVDLAINRRLNRLLSVDKSGLHVRTAVSGSNEAGPVDRTLSCLTFRALEDQRVVAQIVNFPCHPVGFPHRRTISAHYVDAIRDQVVRACYSLESGSNRQPVVGFIQGFSGDVRPKSTSTMRPSRTGLKRLLLGPGYSEFTESDYASWLEHLRNEMSDLLQSEGTQVRSDSVKVGTAVAPRHHLLVGSQSDSPFEVATMSIGPFVLVGASGELVTDYATWLREELPETLLMLGGCMGDVVGYIPTEAMRQRGGYEADGFCRAFSARAVPEGIERSVRATIVASLQAARVLPATFTLT